MKKNLLISLFSLIVSTQCWALTELEISGELDTNLSLVNLPSGQRGNTSFNIPTLFLNLNVPLERDNVVVLNMEGSEQKDLSASRFDLGMRAAYLDLVSPFQGMHALRVGLVPQVWQEAQYQDWSYRFLGKSTWVPTEKWGYLSYSDLGFSFMSELPESLGEWAFSFTNGEGAKDKETGPHKEAAVFVRLFRYSPWVFSLSYVRGNYEAYGADVGVKDRAQALVSYRKEDAWSVNLELLYAKDPADALTKYSMAEGVGVTDFTGQSVEAYAASLYTVYSITPVSEAMFRYDYLNAAVGVSGKTLQTGVIAYSHKLTEDVRTALALEYTAYGVDYGPGVRDNSKADLGLQVLF